MVNTRANSYTGELPVPTSAVTAMATTTVSTFTTAAMMTTTTTAREAIAVTSALSSPAPSVTHSLGSSLGQSTPETPQFSSLTAQNVQREMRERMDANLGNMRVEADRNAESQLHDVINSAIGVGQMELIRLLDERLKLLVPQLVQQRLDVLAQTTSHPTQHIPVQSNQPHSNQIAQPAVAHNVHMPHMPNVSSSQQPNVEFLLNAARPIEGNGGNPDLRPNPSYQPRQAPHSLPQWNPQFPEQPPSSASRLGPRRVEMDKWRLKFDGTSKSITAEDFIFRLEQLCQDYDCGGDEVLIKFPQFLEGPAEDWYWMQRRLGRIHSFQELKETFLSQFRKFESDFDVQRKMMDRRQGPHETFEEFCNAVLRLRNQQREPIPEQMLVEMMKGNLKPAVAALVFPIRMFGLQHFREECRKAELLLANQRQGAQAYRQQFTQRVNEIAHEEPVEDVGVDAISRQANYICWNCREKGHGFMDCPSLVRNLFCFGCGLENVVKPSCPRCKGNRQTSALKGETRPNPMNPQ